VAHVEIGVLADVRHRSQHLCHRASRRPGQRRAQDLPMLRLGAAPMRRRDLLQGQDDAFLDIADDKIGGHGGLRFVINDCILPKLAISASVRMAAVLATGRGLRRLRL